MLKSFVRLIAVTPLLVAGITGCSASAEDQDQESVGESQDRLLAGRRLSEREIAGLVRDAGFPERLVGTMICTAKYESSFYERASNRNSNGSTDRGLFQINSIHLGSMSGCPSSSSALNDARTNTRCAYAIYRAQGLNAWYGYRKHRTECNNYDAPASSGSATNDDVTVEPAGPSASGNDGGCWSATLEDMMDARTCVQSKFDDEWYQCMDGGWYSGVQNGSGRFGICGSTWPLNP